MPELPDVAQEFESHTSPYVAGLEEAIAAAERFRDMNLEALASIDMLDEKMAGAAGSAEQMAGADTSAAEAAGHLRDEAGILEGVLEAVGHQADELALQTEVLDAGFSRLDAQLDDVIAHLGAYGIAAQAAAAQTDAATAATNNASSAQRHGIGWFRLTAQGWHWLVTGITEYLAVAVPGTIALGAAMAVMAQGSIAAFDQMKDLYDVTKATNGVFGQTTSSVLGLSGAFSKAEAAADPRVYQALGSVLDILREHTGELAQAGLKVASVFDEFMARLAYDFSGSGPFGKSGGLMAEGVTDLVEFGQILGNLGHAVDDFAGKMPGMAELLLRVADAASRVVVFISELPKPLIETFMVFHEFNMWGGLAISMLGKLGLATSELAPGTLSAARSMGILSNLFKAVPMLISSVISTIGSYTMAIGGKFSPALERAGLSMRNFGADMTDAVAGMSAGQAAVAALAVAGIGFLIYKLETAKSAAQQFTGSLQNLAEKASNAQVAGVLLDNMNALVPKVQQSTAQLSQFNGALNHTLPAGHAAAGVLAVLRSSQQTYSGALTQTQREMKNLISGTELLGTTYGTTFSQSLGLADAAQVKLINGITGSSQAAQIARQQIEALVSGYKAMDQVGGTLGNDMDVLAAQTGLAATKASSLNQAWDQFLSNATGLTSSFSGLKTDIGEISNAITTSGKAFDTFGGKATTSIQSAAMSMQSFSGTGAQVWTNYDSALQQAEQYTDNLRIAATTGAVGQKEFTQQIAYTAQQLLPYARYSKAATSELSVLVQQAGGPATSSFRTLKDWIDKNTESSKNFMKQTVAETGAMSDATAVAEDYASTLNSQVASALQSATIASSNLTGAAEQFDNAMTKAGGHLTGPVHSAFAGLITSLYKVYGNTKTAESIANTYARQLGLTSGQVKTLDRDVSGLVGQLSRLHSPPPIDITTEYTTIGTPGTGKGGILPTPSGHQTGTWAAAAGLAVVGESGPELVRFGGGESVLPSWQTAGLTHGGGAGGGGEGTIGLALHIPVNVGGQRVGAATIRQSLTYSRRNPSNNLSLRHR